MKRILLLSCFAVLLQEAIFSQPVNGVIVLDSANLHVIKVWGTAEERAFAYGYLLGAEAADMFINYVKPNYIAGYYQEMRNIILGGVDISFDSVFINEAKAFVNGYYEANGFITDSIDYVDLLIGNSIQDLIALTSGKSPFNCSSLISWGDATMQTELDGKSVVSHMLDYTEHNSTLRKSHVVVVNFPSEPGTQEWLLVHFTGCLVPIDGFNRHVGIFGQAMVDYNGPYYHGMAYLPYGYACRRALESADYNNDGQQDVMDYKSAIEDCPNAFASPGITAVMAEAKPNDSLTALIAENAPEIPMHVYRFNSFPDSIPGDNLYTANSQIARNNAYHFCYRYNMIKNHIGSGVGIGLDENWELMKNYSQASNIQFKQYAPEADFFRLAIRKKANIPGYMETPYVFSINDLFTHPLYYNKGRNQESDNELMIWPNPASGNFNMQFWLDKPGRVKITLHDCSGREVLTLNEGGMHTGLNRINGEINHLPAGVYFAKVLAASKSLNAKVVIAR